MRELADLARAQRVEERIHAIDCDVTRWAACTAAVRKAVERSATSVAGIMRVLRAGEIDEFTYGDLARRQIRDRHAHARLGETERHGAPEAARAAGDDHGEVGWRNAHDG